ncbi:CbtA family protein [Actinomadura rugatobispora]|uniref:CbtA family protein n=1 Tax=Actinomadura rugatobispora TaxID=1994 RepID=A0ABW1AHG0_9ACTN|nr:CbtA family protein [Actinomadura rugatobispora]
MMRSLLVRGMIVGLVAAAAGLLIAWIYGEPQVANAIAFEESQAAAEHAAHGAGHGGHAEEEVVSRTVQQTIGLITAMAFYGAAVGGLFSIAFAFALGRIGTAGARATSGLVALLGFTAVVLVPFLKYPPTPPAVGNPDTIGGRTALYFGMVALGVLATVAAVIVFGRLAPRLGSWNAAIASTAGFALVVAVVFRLTPRPDAVAEGFPAAVLWDFRLASLGVQVVLWATLGLLFGALTERAFRRSAPSRAEGEPVPAA